MLKANKYLRKIKTSLASARRQLKKVGKSKYAKDKRIWAVAIIAIVLVVFWALPAYAAYAPGQLGYNVKRFEESVATTLTPTTRLRDGLRLDFAQRRVNEATYVAIHANDSGGGKVQAAPLVSTIKPDNIKAANTINLLLSQFTATYQNYTTKLAENVDQNKKLNSGDIEQLRKQATQIYTALARSE